MTLDDLVLTCNNFGLEFHGISQIWEPTTVKHHPLNAADGG